MSSHLFVVKLHPSTWHLSLSSLSTNSFAGPWNLSAAKASTHRVHRNPSSHASMDPRDPVASVTLNDIADPSPKWPCDLPTVCTSDHFQPAVWVYWWVKVVKMMIHESMSQTNHFRFWRNRVAKLKQQTSSDAMAVLKSLGSEADRKALNSGCCKDKWNPQAANKRTALGPRRWDIPKVGDSSTANWTKPKDLRQRLKQKAQHLHVP